MKKYIPLLLSVLLLLTGCGSGQDTEAEYTENASFETDALESSVNAYTTLEKAQEAIGFAFSIPSSVPGYTQGEISVVKDANKLFAQVNYKKDSYNLTYRVSQTTPDLNADRSTYDNEKEIAVRETTVSCKCTNDITYVATWQKDGSFYCIMADEGLDTTALSVIIASIP